MDNKNVKYLAVGIFGLLAIRRLTLLIDSFSFLGVFSVIAFTLIIVALLQSMPILSAIGFSVLAIVALVNFAPIFPELKWLLRYDSWLLLPILFKDIVADILLACASINLKSAKTFGIIAACVEGVGLLAVIIRNIMLVYNTTISTIFFSLVFIVGALLVGYIYSNDTTLKPIVAMNSENKTSPQKSTNDNKIEKLMQLKLLLDNGVITQEEFEEKKKQMLNM